MSEESLEVTGESANIENAVDGFLSECGKKLENRNVAGALESWKQAEWKVGRHPKHPAVPRWKYRLKELQLLMDMADVFAVRAKPFERRFRVFAAGQVSNIAYRCWHSLNYKVRYKVACQELKIPSKVEFDSLEHDQNTLHATVLVGDFPMSAGRVRVETGENGVRWPVLDRIATLYECELGNDQKPKRNEEGRPVMRQDYRRRGHAKYLLEGLTNFLALKGFKVLVIHTYVLCDQKMLELLVKKTGFQLVLTPEEVLAQKGQPGTKPPLVYVQGNDLRINSIHFWCALPGSSHDDVTAQLAVIQSHCRHAVELANDPNLREQASLLQKRYFEESPMSAADILHKQQEQQALIQQQQELYLRQQRLQQQSTHHQQHDQQQ